MLIKPAVTITGGVNADSVEAYRKANVLAFDSGHESECFKPDRWSV